MKYYFLLFIVLSVSTLFYNCEKDDICLDSEPKTSRLIIRFKDALDNTQFKSVATLAVQGIGNSAVLNFGTTDSIAIPLNAATDLSQFKFFKNYNETTQNSDQCDFSYTRTDEFVSRACGYRTVFENLSPSIVTDTDNWILSYEIVHTTLNNEDEKHLILYH